MSLRTIVDLYYEAMELFSKENDVSLKEADPENDLSVISEEFKANNLSFAKDLPLMRLSRTKGKKVTFEDIKNHCQHSRIVEIEAEMDSFLVSHMIKSKLISEQLSGGKIDEEIEKLIKTVLSGDIKNICQDKEILNPLFRLLEGDKLLLNKINSTLSIEITKEDIESMLKNLIFAAVALYSKSPKKIIPVSPLFDNIGAFVDFIINDERFPNVFSTMRSSKVQILSKQANYTETETIETLKTYIKIVSSVAHSKEIKTYTKIEFKMAIKLLSFKLINLVKSYKTFEEDIKKKTDSEIFKCLKETMTDIDIPEDITELRHRVVQKVPDFLEKNPLVKEIVNDDIDVFDKLKRLLALFISDKNIEEYFRTEFQIEDVEYYRNYLRNILGVLTMLPSKALKKIKMTTIRK